MNQSSLPLVIGKLIIAAAWADGEIQAEEMQCLKDIIFQLPDLGDDDWEYLQTYLEKPILAEEVKALTDSLNILIVNEDDKYLALYLFSRVINADGIITEDEKNFVRDIKQSLFGTEEFRLNNIDQLLKESISVRNKIHKKHSDEQIFEKAEAQVGNKKLELAGALIACVVFVDQLEDTQWSASTVEDSLRESWGLSEKEVSYVIKTVDLFESVKVDVIRVCRQFYEETTKEERIQFLDILLNVSFADGVMTDNELHEVINITANLKLDHQDFQNALNRFDIQLPVLV